MSHYTNLACVYVNMRRGQFILPIVPSVWPVRDTYVGVIDSLWLCEPSIRLIMRMRITLGARVPEMSITLWARVPEPVCSY